MRLDFFSILLFCILTSININIHTNITQRDNWSCCARGYFLFLLFSRLGRIIGCKSCSLAAGFCLSCFFAHCSAYSVKASLETKTVIGADILSSYSYNTPLSSKNNCILPTDKVLTVGGTPKNKSCIRSIIDKIRIIERKIINTEQADIFAG